jgi:hypothetical protein
MEVKEMMLAIWKRRYAVDRQAGELGCGKVKQELLTEIARKKADNELPNKREKR